MNLLAGYSYNIHGLLNLSSGFFDLSLGTIVVFQNPASRVNRSFFLITTVTFLWVIGFGMASLATSLNAAYGWTSVAYAGIPFISPTVYLLSCHWLSDKSDSLVKPAFLMGAAFALPIVLWPERFLQFTEHSWGRYILVRDAVAPRDYYVAFIVFFSAFALLALRNFFRGWRTARDPISRRQSRNIFLAFIIAHIGSVDFLVKLGLKTYPVGCVCLSGFILVIAYTVLRYKAFETDLVANRFWLLVLIYSVLAWALLPLLFPLVRPIYHRLAAPDLAVLLLVAMTMAGFAAAGPSIYAYLVGRQFWLKRQATSGLAHELKSPIGAIKGAIEILKSSREKRTTDTAERSYLLMIERNVDRLDAYVKDLLNLVRIQDCALEIERKEVNVASLLREVAASHKNSAESKGLRIVMTNDSDLPIRGDDRAIRQVISNLIANSIKFSKRGEIFVRAHQEAKHVRVEIADEGEGLLPEHFERVFDRFFQAPNVSKGSGLGLAIAKGWVEAHGGRIWAESAGLGKGTTVTFTLPSVGK